jgi:hypothetical protein
VADEENLARSLSTLTQPDGSFSFNGLAFGSYRASGMSGDLAGSVGGAVIGPSRSVSDLEVPLEPGAVLLLTYSGEKASVILGAYSEHLLGIMGKYEPGRVLRTVWKPGRVVATMDYESKDGESLRVERAVDLVVGEETKVEFGDE